MHLRLVHTNLDSLNSRTDDRDSLDKKNRTVVFDNLPSTNLTWRKEGLIFWDPLEAQDKSQAPQSSPSGQEAKMCRVSGYRWVERDFDGWNERIRAAAEASMKALKAEMEAEQKRESEREEKGEAMEVDV